MRCGCAWRAERAAGRALAYRRAGGSRAGCVLTQENTMNNLRTTFTIVATAAVLAVSGCAVSRGQETVGAYVDDAGITTAVKARFVGDNNVDASSMKVETLNGTVMLSGFAKNALEKSTAESLAWKVGGVKAVRNEIIVRP
jgi:hyperosmotically inducible periplasmic protein